MAIKNKRVCLEEEVQNIYDQLPDRLSGELSEILCKINVAAFTRGIMTGIKLGKKVTIIQLSRKEKAS